MKRLIWMLALCLPIASQAQEVLAQQEVVKNNPIPLAQAGVETCALRKGRSGKQVQDYECSAVGQLELTPQGSAVAFSLQAKMDSPGAIHLPGQSGYWPEQITVNGDQATLRHHGGKWMVVLDEGIHRIEGRWDKKPERIGTHGIYSRVIWQPDGVEVSQKSGYAWLEEQAQNQATERTSPPSLRVWRLFDDGQIPALTTQVELRVDGPVQRLTFDSILPKGFEPVDWDGNLPMVITDRGELVVVAGQGVYRLSINAFCTKGCQSGSDGLIEGVELPAIDPPWPAQETWSVRSRGDFRLLDIQGHGVDPALAQVPPQWQELPSYRVSEQDKLSIRVRGRGIHQTTDLALTRESWWREDGWIHSDTVEGTAPAGMRISINAPYELGWIEHNGSMLPLTLNGQKTGVAWPQGHNTLRAQSTQSSKGSGHGWDVEMTVKQREIHLPPGMALLWAPGQDSVGGLRAWIDRFTLLSWFGIAVLAMLVRQAFGWVAAAVAVGLAAGWIGTGGALGLLWLVGLASGMAILSNSLPQGSLGLALRWTKLAIVAVLVIAWIPFAGQQARLALHPQLDSAPGRGWVPVHSPHFSSDANMNAHGYAPEHYRASQDEAHGEVANVQPGVMLDAQGVRVTRSLPAAPAPQSPQAAMYKEPVPKSELDGLGLASVGKPLPQWHTTGVGKHYILEETGKAKDPVVLTTGWVVLLRVLGIVLLGWLIARIAMTSWPGLSQRVGIARMRWMAASLLLIPSLAMAQPQVSESLASPSCAPSCASLVQAHVDADESQIVASYRLSVEHPSSWTLPQVNGARLNEVLVDGVNAWWTGESQVRVDNGQARIIARYIIQSDQIEIRMETAPLTLTQQTQGWAAQDTRDGSVWMASKERGEGKQQDDMALPSPASTPPLVEIHRQFSFSGQAGVHYRISRLTRSNEAVKVRVPALDGESMQTPQVSREDGYWVGTLSAGQHQAVWNSQLAIKQQADLELVAMGSEAGRETWTVDHSAAWEIELEGPDTTRALERLPLPGESMRLTARRLPVVKGENQRVDQARWIVQHTGPTQTQHSIEMMMTLAQAQVRTLALPQHASLEEVRLNGRAVVVQPREGKVEVSIPGGTHTLELRVHTPREGGLVQKLPQIDLGGDVYNLQVQFPLPADRWLLGAWGPGWGPAVMYWAELLVLLVVALGLAKLPISLGLRSALLLVLGLSTQSGVVIWLVLLVAWLAVISWRENVRVDRVDKNLFNLAQLFMVGLTALVILSVGASITKGLLGATADMSVIGPRTGGGMNWWIDQAKDGLIDGPTLISAPKWVYQLLLFAWTLWFATWGWGQVKRALTAWMREGYWKGITHDDISSNNTN